MGLTGDVTEDWYHLRPRMSLPQLEMEVVQAAVGVIQQDQSGGHEGNDLPGKLRTDRSGRAGEENYAALYIRLNGGSVQVVWGAPQQVRR